MCHATAPRRLLHQYTRSTRAVLEQRCAVPPPLVVYHSAVSNSSPSAAARASEIHLLGGEVVQGWHLVSARAVICWEKNAVVKGWHLVSARAVICWEKDAVVQGWHLVSARAVPGRRFNFWEERWAQPEHSTELAYCIACWSSTAAEERCASRVPQ